MNNVNNKNRVGGLLVPLFALRGKKDLGCGNVGALKEFIDWSASYGFRLVQLLPVNETGADNSPYNAISSVALEPTTIDLYACEDIKTEEIDAIAGLHGVDKLRKGSTHWAELKALNRLILRKAFEAFKNGTSKVHFKRKKEFDAFTNTERSWINGYALFRVLMDRYHCEQWDLWPESVGNYVKSTAWIESLSASERAAIDDEVLFFQYVQWIAFQQWAEVKAYADQKGVQLMGDVPFGVNYYSADVWTNPELFNLQWSGGAPPEPAFVGDEFTRRWGQNWGVPLYNWDIHRAQGFAWWLQRVRKVGIMFHMFRIDHVLGFYRIYGFPWRPQRNTEFAYLNEEQARTLSGGELPRFHDRPDNTPEQKQFNREQGEVLLKILQGEAGQGALVGEDLGTVPDYVRPSLLSLGIAGFKVPIWEEEPDRSLTPGSEYADCTISTYATHDHDPLRVMWERWMTLIETALTNPEIGQDRDRAWWEVRRLANWAGFEVPHIMTFDAVHELLLDALFRSNSRIAIVMITDLLGTSQRFNVPGEVSEANWSSRLAVQVAELSSNASDAQKLGRIRDLLTSSGR